MDDVAEDRPPARGALAELVTIGITAFRRPLALRRLEDSIRRTYPDLPTLVVDTGSNLSRARNLLAQAAATPFLLLCEDDFEFCAQTRIEPLAAVLLHDAEIAGVGGALLEARGRACWAHNYQHRGGEIVAIPSSEPLRLTPGGVPYQPCELILNFGLFRRDLFAHVPWDEDLPLNEHLEYYWRVSRHGAGRMAVVREVAALHHKDRPDEEYRRFRRRSFLDLANAKHGARFRTEDGAPRPPEDP